MSNPNSPSRDTVSPSSSAMDSSTFYSINDSDFDTMNLSTAADVSASNLFAAAANRTGGDETLTNISQTTLNFILDEKQQQKQPRPKTPVNTVNTAPATPLVTPPTPPILADAKNGNLVVDDAVDVGKPVTVGVPSAPTVPVVSAATEKKPAVAVPLAPRPLPDTSIIVLDDEDDYGSNDTAVIELSSDDDNNSELSSAHLTNQTLTDESLDSRSGSLPEEADTSAVANVASDAGAAGDATPEIAIKMYKTVDEFERNLPSTVTVLQGPDGAKVYVVGTAHFSRASMDDVSLVIRNVRPDVVMVELCPSRIHILKHDEKTLLEEASNINLNNIRSILRQNGLLNGLFYIVLLKMSAKLTQELGMAPGGEFRRALEEVHRLENCILHLGDRPINITLQRALHGLSVWQTLKIVWKLVSSDEKISKEDVEKCKQADMLEELMAEMAGEYPEFRDVFVTERDLYLCHSLQVAATQHVSGDGHVRPVTVVGVVGIGHVAGITQHWGKVNVDRIPEITTIPQPSRSSRVMKFAIKWTVLGAIGYGVYRVVGPRLPAVKMW